MPNHRFKEKLDIFLTEVRIKTREALLSDLQYFIIHFSNYLYKANKTDIISDKIYKINKEAFNCQEILNTENYHLIRKHILSEIQTTKARTGFCLQDIVWYLFYQSGFNFYPQYGNERSDFALFADKEKTKLIAIISVKYNIRERWKQIIAEKKDGIPMYLITLDKEITLKTMQCIIKTGIQIVHPEPYDNMMGIDDFFKKEVPRLMESLK